MLVLIDGHLVKTAGIMSFSQTNKKLHRADTNKPAFIWEQCFKDDFSKQRLQHNVVNFFITMSCVLSLAPYVFDLFVVGSWRLSFYKILFLFNILQRPSHSSFVTV